MGWAAETKGHVERMWRTHGATAGAEHGRKALRLMCGALRPRLSPADHFGGAGLWGAVGIHGALTWHHVRVERSSAVHPPGPLVPQRISTRGPGRAALERPRGEYGGPNEGELSESGVMVSWCQRQVPPPAGGSCPRSRPGQSGTIPQQVQHPVRRSANPLPPSPHCHCPRHTRHGQLQG